MTAFATHFLFEFRTGVRNRQLLMMNYLFPLGFYLMMGFIMTQINPFFKDAIIPAMVVFATLAATLLGLPNPLVEARAAGIFRNFKINGISSAAIVTIPALTTLLHLSIVAAIICISAPVLFDAPVPTDWLAFAATFLVLAFACTGIGILIGVMSPDTRATMLWSQALFVPSMLLGGMMMPMSILPKSAQAIARLLPATHAMIAFNGFAMGADSAFDPARSVGILLLGGVLAFALALYLFSWDSQNTRRRAHPALALLVIVPFLLDMIVAMF
jgi:ABC-2 type transport system permease protein